MIDLALPQPYLLVLGDVASVPHANTGVGPRDWARERCVGEYGLPAPTVTTDLPRLTPAQANAQGAQSLVIGVAPPGGVISVAWVPALVEALEAGLDLLSGMHTRLESVPELQTAPARLSRRLIKLPQPRAGFPVRPGRKGTRKRLLAGGTH